MLTERTFTVEEFATSIADFVDQVPEGTTEVRCIGKGLTSLEGASRLPKSVTTLDVYNNRIRSLCDLQGLVGSNVLKLDISNNLIVSLQGLVGSNVITLFIRNNRISGETALQGLVGSNVSGLNISGNQVSSLQGLVGSKVSELNISSNLISSLQGLVSEGKCSKVSVLKISDNLIKSWNELRWLVGSNVTDLDIRSNNPVYREFEEKGGNKNLEKIIKDLENDRFDVKSAIC